MNEEEVSNEIMKSRDRYHEQANINQAHELRITILERSIEKMINARLDSLETNINNWREKHDNDAQLRHEETVKLFDKLPCAKGDICAVGKEKFNAVNVVFGVVLLIMGAILSKVLGIWK